MFFNGTNRMCLIAITGVYLITGGCIKPSAVDDFAKVSAQASQMFPAVASVAYEGCIATQTNAQLSAVKTLPGQFTIDQTAIDGACANSKATEQRLEKSYAVLSAYIQSLAKLAGGKAPTYDTNITGLVNEIPGLSATQQPAVAGLASVIVDAFTNHWREREAAKAIERAQPFVLELTTMFRTDIPKFLGESLDVQQRSLVGLYGTASETNRDGQKLISNPVLIAKNYTDADVEIKNKIAAVKAFQQIVEKIGEGHTALYNKRNQLFTRDTMQQLFQTASAIETQVQALQSALKG